MLFWKQQEIDRTEILPFFMEGSLPAELVCNWKKSRNSFHVLTIMSWAGYKVSNWEKGNQQQILIGSKYGTHKIFQYSMKHFFMVSCRCWDFSISRKLFGRLPLSMPKQANQEQHWNSRQNVSELCSPAVLVKKLYCQTTPSSYECNLNTVWAENVTMTTWKAFRRGDWRGLFYWLQADDCPITGIFFIQQ